MRMKPFLFIGVGVALAYIGRDVGLRGDMAPLVPGGVSPERAKYHMLALVLMLGALACFISAAVSLFRGLRNR